MKIPFRLGAVAACALGLAATADASTLIGTEYGGTTPLYTVSTANGALTAGPATGQDSIGDLASSGSDATVWGIRIPSNTLYQFDASSGSTLATIPVTGAVLPTGGPAGTIVSIAYDAKGPRLYGNTAQSLGGGNTDLYSRDPSSGAASWIGNLQINSMFALAFDTVDGFLYGVSGGVGESSFLWRINPTNATTALIGQLRTTGNFDIAFRPEDNVLYMASSGDSALYTVDITNATTTLVGAYGSATNIAGLAFAVPEPQTYVMMLGGLAAVAGLARRRMRAGA